MAERNMEKRREIAQHLRKRRLGNSKHPRWGKPGLRVNGDAKDGHYVCVLTIPAKITAQVADAYERDQRYTCHVDDKGRIIFTPEVN